MNIAILHYHLRSGGVGSVVRAQAEALSRFAPDDRVVVLSGTPSETDLPVPVKVVSGLDYAAHAESVSRNATGPRAATAATATAATAGLADEMERALDEAFPGGCDLLHVHNPLIRKNAALLGALAELQRRGLKLLVQVHDLAEDFRPDVYHDHSAYPRACAYAAINTRDRDRLVASGLDPRHVHLLPNPVAIPAAFEARGGWREELGRGRRTALYPVRAIRRKNLGEVLLLAHFLPAGTELAVTLPPTSPRDLPGYAAWKNLAAERFPRVRFEAGLGAQLAALYESSFCAVTTSVKEGFGYSYLDPIARGIPVVGREIPYVVADFRAHGIALPGLYREIRIPRAVLSEKSLRAAVELRIESFRRAYSGVFASEDGSGLSELEELLGALARRFEEENLDFGALDEGLQNSFLRRLGEDASLDRDLRTRNPFLPELFEARLSSGQAESLRGALAAAYSAESCAGKLRTAYRDAVSEPIDGGVDRRALLARYLVPESFFLVAS